MAKEKVKPSAQEYIYVAANAVAEVDALASDADNPAQENCPLNPESAGTADEQTELEMLRQQNQQLTDQYLRTLADLENVRRRHRQELVDKQQIANERLIHDLLPVLDNLHRALEAAKVSEEGAGLKAGVQMTARQFMDVLKHYGVSPIESVGQPFDPAHHEAIGQLETDDQPEGAIAAEVQRGYLLHGRTLRPSRVMVAKKKE